MHPDSHPPPLTSQLDSLLSDIRQTDFLGMGTGNPHWLVTAASGRYVWRQFRPANPGVERARELAVMQAVQGRGWAPELIAHLPGEGLLMREAPGSPLNELQQAGRTLTAKQRTLILQAVTECWQIRTDLPSCDYAGLIQHYAQLALQQRCDTAQIDTLSTQLLQDCADWPITGLRLTHHDLHPGNLLLSATQCTLIDWEFAALGNPWLDAVMLDQMLQLNPTEKQQLEQALADYPLPLSPDKAWTAFRRWKEGFDRLWYLSLPNQT